MISTDQASRSKNEGMKSSLKHLFPCLLLGLAPLIHCQQESDATLADFLPSLVEQSEVPSIAAAVVSSTELLDAAADGFRKDGDPTRVTLDDKYHLGSCTKTMTATLAAILVDEGLIRWDSTIGELLGEIVPEMNASYRPVTLEQLLAHVGGFGTQPPSGPWLAAWASQGKQEPREQRLAFAEALLSLETKYMPNTSTEYSNQGYAVAGVMLETATNTPWEALIEEKLFRPLEMDSAGFRAPASPETLDQPWGHRAGQPVPPGPGSDNPDAIGPAGTVHASIRDWAKFAQYHLRGEPAPLLKSEETLSRLHQTLPESGKHGIGGWLVHDIDQFGGHSLQMVGSNTMWYSLFWVLSERDIAIVVTTNSGDAEAFRAMDQVASFLIQQHVR